MELYKFISKNKVKKYNGGFVVIDKYIYTNPKEDAVKKAGYKPLVEVTVPEFDIQTEYIAVTFVEEDDYIVPVYKAEKFEVLENEQCDQSLS